MMYYGLDVVTRLGYAEDRRIDDALELLVKGTSKLVTLYALRVIKRVQESRGF